MRFGFESEKILFDSREHWVSNTALSTLLALEDYTVLHGEEQVKRVTGEFVHNLVEMVSSASSEVDQVAKDYLISYELSRQVSERTDKHLLPLGSFPLRFTPVMVEKFQYYVKNAILSERADIGWDLKPEHRLFDAANCAGVHVHAEVTTLPEFLNFSRELMDKHNAALAVTPLMAFASSPYFDGIHTAMSMRAKRYYHGVYQAVPEIGGFPPMMKSSEEVLLHYQTSMKSWEQKGKALGFEPAEIRNMTAKGGGNWGLVRWNRKWNTIELRCFDSDFVAMDLAKFTITSRALKRFDIEGEHLQTRILAAEVVDHSAKALDALLGALLADCWETSGREVAVLPTVLMHRLINLSIDKGLRDPLVHRYVEKLVKFAQKQIQPREAYFAHGVIQGVKNRETTSDRILRHTGNAKELTRERALELVDWLIDEESKQYRSLIQQVPQEIQPPRNPPFPSAPPSLH